MPKEFYTERDIEDMFKRGILSLQVNDNVVLTDLAYEKANRLGMQLQRQSSGQHAQGMRPVDPPAAPVRPYISQVLQTEAPVAAAAASAPAEADLTSSASAPR